MRGQLTQGSTSLSQGRSEQVGKKKEKVCKLSEQGAFSVITREDGGESYNDRIIFGEAFLSKTLSKCLATFEIDQVSTS